MDIIKALAVEFRLEPRYVENIIALIDEGNTIPFIARYRKEQIGPCDDQILREFGERLVYLRGLEKRKADVAEAIRTQEKMTDELERAIESAATLAEVEDIYRPYRPKRRTRAIIARERGLGPLADIIYKQELREGSIEELAAEYIDAEKGVEDAEAAIAGALDIIAETLSEDAELRKRLRRLAEKDGALRSWPPHVVVSVYRLYYDFKEPAATVPSHRILAINRGEKEEILRVSVEINEALALGIISRYATRGPSITRTYVERAAEDAWKRLIAPSLEREIRNGLTERASEQAIRMFGVNARPLLMQPPLRGKVVLGLDPAYRTGCKIAVVDATGKVLDTTVVYPTPPQNKKEEAKKTLKALIAKHGVEVISIGNGTASKESEIFIAELIRELPEKLQYMVVNEAGASVYSASKLAAEEFPDFDVSLRSAVSIARRLQDPMAELVKIDPKAIGVGQYQHDMPEARLEETLSGVVEACVNSVGVDVNTASAPLLSYVSGLGPATSKNICAYREANGRFNSRAELKKVPKLGPKAFEQCAGFLRIAGGRQILDNTAVHPESYTAAEKLLSLFGYGKDDVKNNNVAGLSDKLKEYGEEKAAEACCVGVPTLRDMAEELMKPGRDIRDNLPPPVLREDVLDIKDLVSGMEFTGTVRNVIDFGVFVDIGVHQDGLVHISQIGGRYIKHPSEVLKVGDIVRVRVLEADPERKRISLTMKDVGQK